MEGEGKGLPRTAGKKDLRIAKKPELRGRGEKQEVVTGGGKGRIGFRRPGMELDVEVK